MSIDLIKEFLIWCLIINYGILLIWFVMFVLARNWIYRLHSRWFKISFDRFAEIHYAEMARLKILIFVFNLAPFLALCIID